MFANGCTPIWYQEFLRSKKYKILYGEYEISGLNSEQIVGRFYEKGLQNTSQNGSKD